MTHNKFNKPTEQFNFFGIAIVLLIVVGLSFFIDVEKLEEFIVAAGAWGPVVFIFLKILTIVIAPLSGSALYPIVGLLFGFWPGLLYVTLADFLGYTIAFFIGRIFGQKVVLKLISSNEKGMLAKIVDRISTSKGFLQAGLALFAAPELLAYGAGLSKLSYGKFILIMLPISTAVSSVLVFFGSVFDFSGSSLLITVILPILGIILMFFSGWLFARGLKNGDK